MPIGVYPRSKKHKEHLSESARGRYLLSLTSPGEKYLWNNGRRIASKGYIKIYSPNNPFQDDSGYVFEHRIVMEKWLCENEPNHPALIGPEKERYLNPDWVVHHINGIKDDNRIENLEVKLRGKHTVYHLKGRHHSNLAKMKISLAKQKAPRDKKGRFAKE